METTACSRCGTSVDGANFCPSCGAATGGAAASPAYDSLKVAELRALLAERGLRTSGTKPELVQRLHDDDTSTAPPLSVNAEPAPEPAVTAAAAAPPPTGWYRASDGNWYPPAAPQGFPQPQKGRSGCLIAAAVVGAVAVLGVILLVVILAVAANRVSHVRAVGGGTSAHPASADVAVDSCSLDPTLNVLSAKGVVTNHSSKKSNYIFSVEFLNAAGDRIGSGGSIENDVVPGQRVSFEVSGAPTGDTAGLHCNVAEVTRLESR